MPRMPRFLTMVRALAPPPGSRWPASTLTPALSVVIVIGAFLLHGAGVAAQVVSYVNTTPSGSNSPVPYFILNVEVSDAGIQPSAAFIPAGQPVRMVLRGRDRTEHHYRVVGLVPDELSWMAEPASVMEEPASAVEEDVSDTEHDHHDSAFVGWRETSPAGITPTGDEVHAYVTAAKGVDVVLFSTTQTGTFVVQCDLHPEQVSKLVVFDDGRQPVVSENALNLARRDALSIAPGDALSRLAGNPMGLPPGDPLSVELSRDLGSMDQPGASPVFMEATYAPAEYEALILGGLAAMAELEPDRYVAVLLTEGVRTGRLPGRVEPPDLYLGGSSLTLIDSNVTIDLPQRRATFYWFAHDDASGSRDQVMTLRLASGQEATWDLSSSGGWNWLVPAIFAGGLGLFGWLVWMMAGGKVRKATTS